MKKIIFLGAIISILWSTGSAADSPSGRLEDVVVKGSDASKLESEKIPVQLNFDASRVISPSLETEKFFLEKLTPAVNKMKMTNPDVLSTDGTISPWLSSIVHEPVATFRLGLEKLVVKSWDMVITDSRGYKFRQFTGKGTIPETIAFSGRNDDNNFMRVGNVYGYIATYTEENGPKRTVIGKPFSYNAALHQEKEGLVISLFSKAVFEKNDQDVISEAGKLLVTEAADIMKGYFNVPAVINVYAESEGVGMGQARAINKELSKKLVMPENKMALKGFRDIPENFHIDIVILNKKAAS